MNYLAIVVAAAASFAVGGAWYSPMAFGPAWLAAIGKKPEEMGSPARPLAITAALTLVSAYVLAWVIAGMGITSLIGGAGVGLSIGIGLVATAMATDVLFTGGKLELLWINAGQRTASLVVMGAILGAWR